jgi:hypothetical protein
MMQEHRQQARVAGQLTPQNNFRILSVGGYTSFLELIEKWKKTKHWEAG